MHYSFKSTPTYTFKSRNQTVTKSNQFSSVPGPADYNANKPLHRAATISPTKEQRNLYNKFQSFPAPGAYEAKSYIRDGPKRSMSARYIEVPKKTPGPQQYDNNTLKVKNNYPAFTMSLRSKSSGQIAFDQNDYKPGPTAYQVPSGFSNSGAFIGGSKRRDLTETEKTPAPGYYSAQSASVYASNNNPRCKIGNNPRKTDFNSAQQTPGPAFYSKKAFVEENQHSKKGFSCRQKTADLIAMELSKFPAPGQYDANLKNKNQAPRCATSQAKRKTFMDDMQKSTKQLPGPGIHNPGFNSTKYRSSSAFNFGKSSRKPLDQNQRTPGPVGYAGDKINVMRTAPRYSSTKSLPKNQFLSLNPQNPGPGYYDVNIGSIKSNSQMFQVPKQQRPNFDKERYTPGPGFYNIRGKQAGPNWKFSNEKRIAFTDKNNEAKGGELYEIPSMVVNPPKYMNVDSKLKFNPSQTNYRSTGLTHK